MNRYEKVYYQSVGYEQIGESNTIVIIFPGLFFKSTDRMSVKALIFSEALSQKVQLKYYKPMEKMPKSEKMEKLLSKIMETKQ